MSKKPAEAPRRDPRAMRSRFALSRALIALSERMPVDSIRVIDLIREAEVSRATFYAHFSSREDFLARAYATMLVLHVERDAKTEPHRSQALPSLGILMHVHRSRKFAMCIHQSRDRPAMQIAGEQRLRAWVQENLRRLHAAWPDARRQVVAVVLSGAFMAMLRWWFEGGLTVPVARVDTWFQSEAVRICAD